MVLSEYFSELRDFYEGMISFFPPTIQDFIGLFVLVVLITFYVVFIWKFYRFIGTRDIFHFDLRQYSKSEHPFISKFSMSALYFLEYILIIPLIVFFWYIIFTFFLIVLVEESLTITLGLISLLSAVVIASVRMATYIPQYGEDVAKELAKLLPLVLLGVAISDPGTLTDLAQRVFVRLGELSEAIPSMANYVLFIILLEVVLRFFTFVFSLFGKDEEEVLDETEPEGEVPEESS